MAQLAKNKFNVPAELEPTDMICAKVMIPNEPTHLANFIGALYELAQGHAYPDDTAHTAKTLSRYWKIVLDGLEIDGVCMEDWTIRLNPDDCTEVQQFDNATMDYADVFSLRCAIDTVISEEFPENNPPGSTQPGTQPGGNAPAPGQCFTLSFDVSGYTATLIPIRVAANWTIQIVEVLGATTDGRLGQFPPYLSLWRCGNGQEYQLGSCFGATVTSSSDPAPTDPHLAPLIQYPDGTYQVFYQGDIITVPSTMIEGSYQLILNNSMDTPLTGLPSGQLKIKLILCSPGGDNAYAVADTAWGTYIPALPVYVFVGTHVSLTGTTRPGVGLSAETSYGISPTDATPKYLKMDNVVLTGADLINWGVGYRSGNVFGVGNTFPTISTSDEISYFAFNSNTAFTFEYDIIDINA